MKKLYQIIFFLAFLNLYAQDNNLIYKVLNQLNLKTQNVDVNLVETKVLPYAKEQTVLVIPKYDSNQENNEFTIYDAYIIIANNKSGEILYTYFESKKWTSDAIRITGFKIDTGLYKLSDNVRAFGIRTTYLGRSQLYPYDATHLSLYVTSKNKLKQIANDIIVSQSNGHWDGNCQGEFENQEIIIDIAKEKTNGFYNLILRNKITNTKTNRKGNDCNEVSTTENKTSKLKFNGKFYL
ncbi:hypothetical protein [Flavobacterium sp. I3-2]|uniref:hypothetical protein n=1 Tax=Flavobacterium sp. I3-2 TaxID=2748319 RepID=UPI0015AD331E|nr:hypothetical protein [Flavobacterium sp. I3-2]